MGKDAVSNTRKKNESPSKSSGASPIIFIIAIIGLAVGLVILFHDKIFKKQKNLSDSKQESQIEQELETSEPEQKVLSEEEAQTVTEQFEDVQV